MAKIRIGIGSDFRLNDQKLGLGENNPQERLDVAGVAKGKDLKVTGISSLTAYEGFLRADHQITENTTLSFDQGPSASLSGEIIVGTGKTVTVTGVGLGTTTVGNGSGTIENTIDTTDVTRAGGSEIECLKVFNTFTPPSGGTNERPEAPKPGQLYYNYDFKTIEFFDGNGWRQVDNTTRSGRGVFTGGYHPMSQKMDYINISTQGNSISFGELFESSSFASGKVSDGKRGVIAGGRTSPGGSFNGTMQYYTFASGGNSIDFGNQSANRRRVDSVSSSTRGVIAGGATSPGGTSDVIDYIEIQTLGNALDFGNLSDARYSPGGICNSTRGVFFGGGSTDAEQRIIEYITIASKGDAVDFGECTQRSNCQGGGFSDGTRGVLAGGYGVSGASSHLEQIEQINIASTGNSFDFGILHQTTRDYGGAQNMTRAVLAGGRSGPTDINNITQISLTTSGTSEDFGDLTYGTTISQAGGSDSHGGLGGF